MLKKFTKFPFVRTLITTLSVFLIVSCQKNSDSEMAASQGAENTSSTEVVSFQEFKKTVGIEPETGFFILDGDMVLSSEEKLMEFYKKNVLKQVNNQDVSSRLIVGYENGEDLIWDAYDRVNLKYCVDTSFGSNYGAVVAAMQSATSSWEAAAGHSSSGQQVINFKHISSADSSCQWSGDVLFRVLPGTSHQYHARAFFPGDPGIQRTLYITNSSFHHQDFSLRGILTHEVGHILGFRHETVRYSTYIASITYGELEQCYGESGEWKDLSDQPWDDYSVMETPECNPFYFITGDLNLSQQDIEGVRKAYTNDLNTFSVSEGTSFSIWNWYTTYNVGDLVFYPGDNYFYKAKAPGLYGSYYAPTQGSYWTNLNLSVSVWIYWNNYDKKDIVYHPENNKFYECQALYCVAATQEDGTPTYNWLEIDLASVIIHGRGE